MMLFTDPPLRNQSRKIGIAWGAKLQNEISFCMSWNFFALPLAVDISFWVSRPGLIVNVLCFEIAVHFGELDMEDETDAFKKWKGEP